MLTDNIMLELEATVVFLVDSVKLMLIVLYIVAMVIMSFYAVWFIITAVTYWYSEHEHGEPYLSGYPRVVIIVPVKNDYAILDSIESILSLDYPNYKVVVVDDSNDDMLLTALANLSFKTSRKLIHLVRNRKGLKGAALNDALLVIEKYSPKYVVFLDADFEPKKDFLRKAIAAAEKHNADILQGYQRHFKGSKSVFGRIYRASQGGAIVNLYGRSILKMLPIFTGSCAIMKYDVLRKIKFKDNSLCEDWRFTIDYLLEKSKPSIVVRDDIYADGSVPATLKAYVRQQLRWSQGTLLEFSKTFWHLLLLKVDLKRKIDYIFQGMFFTQGLWVYIAIAVPIILYFIFGVNVAQYTPAFDVYLWLIGIETIIMSGAILEKYEFRYSFLTFILALPFIYFTSVVHAYGTLMLLLLGKYRWIVTPKESTFKKWYKD